MICAYRTEAVGPHHPLRTLINSWAAAGLTPPELVLGPLSSAAASELVGSMLRQSESEAQRLAAALGERTLHNPGDTIVLLNALRDDDLLTQDKGLWSSMPPRCAATWVSPAPPSCAAAWAACPPRLPRCCKCSPAWAMQSRPRCWPPRQT